MGLLSLTCIADKKTSSLAGQVENILWHIFSLLLSQFCSFDVMPSLRWIKFKAREVLRINQPDTLMKTDVDYNYNRPTYVLN